MSLGSIEMGQNKASATDTKLDDGLAAWEPVNGTCGIELS
jgi:hypothetical protein